MGVFPQSDFARVFGFGPPLAWVLLRLFVGVLLPLGPWPRSSSPVEVCGKFVEGMGVMGRMKPSPNEEGPASWLGHLKRFALYKQILTRAVVIASSFALRELLQWLLHLIRD